LETVFVVLRTWGAAVLLSLAICFAGTAAFNPAHAQVQTPPGNIEQIMVSGNERVEPVTIVSYLTVRAGDPFSPLLIDASLKALFSTGLFSDVVMERDGNNLIIRVTENPVINRIVFEGNKRLDREDLLEEVQLRPRMVYTRSRVREDVQRIIELYRRSGRFAAVVEPKIVLLEQNRVDLVFEMTEGPKSRISRINFLGNRVFSDRELRGELATKEARWWKIFSSNDTYDPDRLAFDRELLRQYYLSKGYADFRVNSAVAELTPDQRDFFVTITVHEGELYRFGKLDVESDVRDLMPALFQSLISAKEGRIYNAKKIEDTVDLMTEWGGLLGYAFLEVNPQIRRVRDQRVLDVTFKLEESQRTYIERIDIHGNVRTLDRVIRREFRLAEGDAFSSSRVNRSETRLNALGFFRNVEIEQERGSQPDRVVIDVTVEEQATGELSLGVAFSSFESFLVDFSIRERNLLGKGQELRLGASISSRRKQINLGFTEPYFLNRELAAGIDLFRTELDSFTESSFQTTSTGGALRTGFRLDETVQLGLRYTLRRDNVRTDFFFSSPFVQAAQGANTTSSIGYSLFFDTVDNFLRPSRGTSFRLSQDFAGLGGSVKYLRTSLEYDYYKPITGRWIFHLGANMGYIKGIGQDVRINDRFFLGNPQMRGFDVAGIGPVDTVTNPLTGEVFATDFLGGNVFYAASAGVAIPLGAAAQEMGVQVTAYIDVGALAKVDLVEIDRQGNPIDISRVFSNGSPRIAVGIGVIWQSPFGPFRIDLAEAIKKERFDKTQFLQFNIGTTF
jgi:outer membrane protein insertion porin family